MKKSNCYLLSWDMTGLETVLDLSEIERLREEANKERVWKTLADPEARDFGNEVERQLSVTVSAILMRARANTQRHYEVYTIHTTPGITEQDMREMFNENPQYAADLIRERGNKLYSDRVEVNSVKIV